MVVYLKEFKISPYTSFYLQGKFFGSVCKGLEGEMGKNSYLRNERFPFFRQSRISGGGGNALKNL